MTFQCERCGRAGRYSTWVTARWRNGNTMQRCSYCGEPHSCAYGRAASAIHPPLLSIDQPGILTPWVDRNFKPYKPGVYECEFSDCRALYLQWDGKVWRHQGLIVDMQTQIKWRGKWQPDAS